MIFGMRILMISDVYFPRINGVSTSIESFRRGLGEVGIESHLVVPAYPVTIADDDRLRRVRSHSLPFDEEDRLMCWRALRKTLADLGRRLRFDLVHVQTPFAAHYAGVAFARQHGIPCLATWHTHFEEYLPHYLPFLPRRPLQQLMRFFARQQCNVLDAVIVPSTAIRAVLESYGVRRPIHRVPTGIPLAQFRRAMNPDARWLFRLRHGLPAEAPIALYVGRVAFEKNLVFLLDAFREATRRLPEAVLVIAGEGPALLALERHASESGLGGRVHFLGYLDRHDELPACYAAADLFVFASQTETQGLVLLEAMAAGLPVLAISALGARDIVASGRGAIAAAEDSAAFGKAMAELLGDPLRRRAMAEQAIAFANEWSIEATSRRLAELYHEIVGCRQCHFC